LNNNDISSIQFNNITNDDPEGTIWNSTLQFIEKLSSLQYIDGSLVQTLPNATIIAKWEQMKRIVNAPKIEMPIANTITTNNELNKNVVKEEQPPKNTVAFETYDWPAN